MFDLSLAHIHRAERERELAADLRDRDLLKAANASAMKGPAAIRPASTARSTPRARALGR